MCASRCRKIKSMLLIFVLANAEVLKVKAASRHTNLNSGDDGSSAAHDPRMESIANIYEHMKLLSDEIQTMMAKPEFQRHVTVVTDEMQALFAEPTVQDLIKIVAKEIQMMMAEPKLKEFAQHVAEFAKTVKDSLSDQELAERFAKSIEVILTDPNLRERADPKLGELAELIGAHKDATETSLKLQKQVQHVAEQMNLVMADPKFQEWLEAVAEKGEIMMADPSFQKHSEVLVEQMKAMMAERNLRDQSETGAKQAKTKQDKTVDAKDCANKFVGKLTDKLTAKLVDQVLKMAPLNHVNHLRTFVKPVVETPSHRHPTSLHAIPPAALAPAMAAPLPSVLSITAACTLPTCLGFWKSEYAVSYAYGAAIAAAGALVFHAAPTTVAMWHAAALITYGVRLIGFLLWRELTVDQTVESRRKAREERDARAAARGGSRLSRAPIVFSCALLYICMAAPTLITASSASLGTLEGVLVTIAWVGLLIAAIGDFTKSFVKAKEGPDALVTSGIFRFFRHPNYTGEQLLWTANLLAGFAAAASGGSSAIKSSLGWLAGSVLGWAGIMFVLAGATAKQEERQSSRAEKFKDWYASSWGGIAFAPKPANATDR